MKRLKRLNILWDQVKPEAEAFKMIFKGDQITKGVTPLYVVFV